MIGPGAFVKVVGQDDLIYNGLALSQLRSVAVRVPDGDTIIIDSISVYTAEFGRQEFAPERVEEVRA